MLDLIQKFVISSSAMWLSVPAHFRSWSWAGFMLSVAVVTFRTSSPQPTSTSSCLEMNQFSIVTMWQHPWKHPSLLLLAPKMPPSLKPQKVLRLEQQPGCPQTACTASEPRWVCAVWASAPTHNSAILVTQPYPQLSFRRTVVPVLKAFVWEEQSRTHPSQMPLPKAPRDWALPWSSSCFSHEPALDVSITQKPAAMAAVSRPPGVTPLPPFQLSYPASPLPPEQGLAEPCQCVYFWAKAGSHHFVKAARSRSVVSCTTGKQVMCLHTYFLSPLVSSTAVGTRLLPHLKGPGFLQEPTAWWLDSALWTGPYFWLSLP